MNCRPLSRPRPLPMNSVHRNSFYNSNYNNDEYDFDDEIDNDIDDEREQDDESDEDTEDASEAEIGKTEEYTEIREQIYQDKLGSLKKQLQQLKDGTHPEYNRKMKKLDLAYRDRVWLNNVWRDYLVETVEKDYINEKRAAVKDLEEKKIELRQSLLSDLEEKRKVIEAERLSMELSGDSTETKPPMTRKLRRRPHDPAPLPDKRRGKSAIHSSNITMLLEDKEVESDLKAINRPKIGQLMRKPNMMVTGNGSNMGSLMSDNAPETRIEDGKLLYERRWFHRGQPVYVEGKDLGRFPAIISAIGNDTISVKKTVDSTKVKILTMQLSQGKVSIKRRAS